MYSLCPRRAQRSPHVDPQVTVSMAQRCAWASSCGFGPVAMPRLPTVRVTDGFDTVLPPGGAVVGVYAIMDDGRVTQTQLQVTVT